VGDDDSKTEMILRYRNLKISAQVGVYELVFSTSLSPKGYGQILVKQLNKPHTFLNLAIRPENQSKIIDSLIPKVFRKPHAKPAKPNAKPVADKVNKQPVQAPFQGKKEEEAK
jgi:hypothetical protein